MATQGTQLINYNLSNLIGGVSEQYQEGRFDSQVSSMVNCIPSLSRGVMRRNPLVAVADLGAFPTDSFVYSYDRGTGDEQYIIVVPGDGSMYVYNANDGTSLYSTTGQSYLIALAPKTAFKALTIGDYTYIVNTTKTVEFDNTITAPDDGYNDMAFYWIKKTTSVTTKQYQSSTNVGSLMKGYKYTLNSATVPAGEETRPTFTAFELNTSKSIATKFASATKAWVEGTDNEDTPATWTGSNYNVLNPGVVAEDSVVYTTGFTGTDWKWADTFGDQASLGVWKTVKDSDELPINLPSALDGFVVKVSGGTSAEFDDYYLKYTYSDKSWKEVAAPGSLTTLDATTMPHVLYGLVDGSGNRTFTFNTYQGVTEDGTALTGVSEWGIRESGGDDTLEDPSFVGKKIANIFFHKNRLGFLTADSVVLSRTGDYGNFFIQTLQEVLDDDPIDLSVASTDVTVLRHAVPTAGQLILFADDTQFSLTSLDGALTPKSADIAPLSNYTYGSGAPAKSVGNRVFFTNQVGGSSQIYSYKVSDQGSQITEAIPMTLHLPTYLNSSVSKIIGHDVLGYVFFEETLNPNRLTVLSSVIRGTEELQNSFHRWEFEYDILSTQIINNALYILFTNGYLCSMDLSVPDTIQGKQYQDEYTDGVYTNYTSYIDFSEFFVRDGQGKGTVRGRFQLRTMKYTIDEDSEYTTTIADTNSNLLDSTTMYGPTYTDTDTWNDNLIWADVNPYYTREYHSDELVTIMADSKRVRITFKSSTINPDKGFELATANIEGFFHQRSLRR